MAEGYTPKPSNYIIPKTGEALFNGQIMQQDITLSKDSVLHFYLSICDNTNNFKVNDNAIMEGNGVGRQYVILPLAKGCVITKAGTTGYGWIHDIS